MVVVLLTSTQTTLETVQALSRFTAEVPVTQLHGEVTSAAVDALEPAWVLDFLNSQSRSKDVRVGCRNTARWINGNEYRVEGETELFTPGKEEIHALAVVLREMNLMRPLVLLAPELGWVESFLTAAVFPVEVSTMMVSSELSAGSLNLIVQKEVKAKAFLNLVLILPAGSALSVLRALEDNNMDETPIALVLSEDSARARSSPSFPALAQIGTLYLVSQNCEDSVNSEDLVYCRLKELFNSTAHSIMSLDSGVGRVIGSVSASAVSLCVSCFRARRGWTSSNTLSPLQISFNNGTRNPSGEADNGESQNYLGAQLALLDVNANDSLLPDHFLRIFNMSLGLNVFNAAWALNQTRGFTKADFGLAFLHGQYSQVGVPLYDFLYSTLNLRIPQAAATILSPALSSTVKYPYFSRTILSTDYFGYLFVKLIQHYGWKRIAVMYCEDAACWTLYERFLFFANQTGIEIVNPPESRKYPSNMVEYPTDRLADYQQIVDSKVRIVLTILYGSAILYSADAFYDLGVRRGDLVFMAGTWLAPAIYTTGTDEQIAKRKEILTGAIQFYPVSFFGSFGKWVKDHFVSTFHTQPPSRACLYYDGLLSIAYSIHDLMVQGKDYEDPWILEKELKSVRFLGCSGEVAMQEGTNDRSAMRFQILNAVGYANGTVKIVEAGIYDPVGLVMFNFSRAIVWPDNTTAVPTDTRTNDIDCPFESKQVVNYLPGMVLAYGILFSVAAMTIGAILIIWRRHWNSGAVTLETRVRISFDDYMLFLTIGLEALQYANMGPPFPNALVIVSQLSQVLNLDLESVYYLRKGVFWFVLTGVLGSVFVWLLLLVFAKTRLGTKVLEQVSLLDTACEKLLPILGNLCFLPFLSVLLNVFQCIQAADYGSGVSLSSTFLHRDCYQTCWQYPHALYACLSAFALLFYIPSAVYFRPTWKDHQPSLHVFTAPRFLMFKSIYQLVLVITNKIISDYQFIGHSLVHILASVLFLAATVMWRPFGYSRANLWSYLSLVWVLWMAALTLLNHVNDAIPALVYLIIFLTGSVLIAVFGLIYQRLRLPSLLDSGKGIPVANLLKFQFSSNKKFLYYLSRFRHPPLEPEFDQFAMNNRQLARPPFAEEVRK